MNYRPLMRGGKMTDPKTSIASYAASSSLVIFGMSANDFAVLVGLIFAAGTFLINWYYKRAHLKLISDRVKEMPFPSLNSEEV